MSHELRQHLLTRLATSMAAVIDRELDDYIDRHGYDPDDPETRAAARQEMLDPRNEVMCETCGWTYGMICPECPGCGCYNGCCSGWRHREFDYEYAEHGCSWCGEPNCAGYCDDYESYNLPADPLDVNEEYV